MDRAGSFGSFLWVLKGDSISHLHGSFNGASRLTINRAHALAKGGKNLSEDSGYLADIDKKKSNVQKQNDNLTKTYKRRFYILFLFSVISFMQYCCWNTFGPISTTCMAAFDWSEKEIALMASLDPITYLLTMVVFSWLMDVKGLRISLIVSVFFMALGTGLRCITSETGYVTWSIATGQFFNGLAGPVTQAAPPLLSASWFPSTERTTATAVSTLCGSLGVALSFIISPSVVKDIQAFKYKNKRTKMNESVPIEITLSETIFQDAIHYWSFNTKNKNFFKDSKSSLNLEEIGNVKLVRGVSNKAININSASGYLSSKKLKDCMFSLQECGHSYAFVAWLKINNKYFNREHILHTQSSSYTIFSVIKISKNKNVFLNIRMNFKNKRYSLKYFVKDNQWFHIAITFDHKNGLTVYINGKIKSRTKYYKYTINRINTSPVGYLKLGMKTNGTYYDEVAVWNRTLNSTEIREIVLQTDNENILNQKYVLSEEYERERKERRQDIMNLLYAEFGINAFLFVCVLLYFPDKPPTPPSLSAHVQRDEFNNGAKSLLKSIQFWTLCFIYGITTGVYSGWGAILNVNLSHFGISQEEAGWLGFYTMLAGISAGMILARCADMFSGRMKALLLLLFIGATGCFLWFCLLCLQMIKFSKDSLYKSAILGGFFVSGTIPLFYELTIEQTYPIPEGITTGVLTMVNNAVTVLFLVVILIPNVGTLWMNWVLFGACAIALPILIIFKEKYRRLDIDVGALNSCSDISKKSKLSEKSKLTTVTTDMEESENLKVNLIDDIFVTTKQQRNPMHRLVSKASLWSISQEYMESFLQYKPQKL